MKIGGKTLSVMKSRLNTRGEPILAYVDGDVEEVATFKVYMAGIADDVGKAAVKKLAEEYGRVVDIEVYRKNAAFVVSIVSSLFFSSIEWKSFAFVCLSSTWRKRKLEEESFPSSTEKLFLKSGKSLFK